MWQEELRVSKYADGLPQLDTGGRKISPNPKVGAIGVHRAGFRPVTYGGDLMTSG